MTSEPWTVAIPQGLIPLVQPGEEDPEDPQSFTCGFRWYYRVYDDTDYETCGEPAVGCNLDGDERPGRCLEHMPNYEYLWAWGYVPQPNEVIMLMDRPSMPGEPDDVL